LISIGAVGAFGFKKCWNLDKMDFSFIESYGE
jgi:hypothetical protein